MTKKDYLDFVETQWKNYFLEKGYIEETAVKITSKVDSSVSLVGSTTSPLKKYILEDNIGNPGRFIIQNCMRTQGMKNLKTEKPQVFGSYFKCMGILKEYSYDNLVETVFVAFDYLLNKLMISPCNIRIRISAADKDLIAAIKDVDGSIVREIDTFSPKYYTHVYGNNILGIYGRNFNIAIRKNGTNEFYDIGNVIIMENDKKKYSIEMGFGNQTLSMTYFGVDSTVAGSRLADFFTIRDVPSMKLADAIISTAVLQYEKVDQNGTSDYFKRLLRQYYAEVINYWKYGLNIDDEMIINYINSFIAAEYEDTSFSGRNTWNRKK